MIACDYDPPEFYSEHRRVARKSHVCSETGRTIAPGETYVLCVGKWDGDFRAFPQCLGAYHFARHVHFEIFKGKACLPFGGIREEIGDMQFQHPELIEEWSRVMAGEVTRNR